MEVIHYKISQDYSLKLFYSSFQSPEPPLFSLESIPSAYLSLSFFLVCLKHVLTLGCQVILTNEGLV